MLRQDVRILRADLASTAFGKNTAVYGYIDENGSSVRKFGLNWLSSTVFKNADKVSRKSTAFIRHFI